MKILVTGKNGQVGYELMRTLSPLGQVIGVDIKDCDFRQSAAINELVDRVKPDLIINTAAYTEVDKAESEPTVAHALNAQAPKVLALQASRRNIPIIHFSTDYIFDGKKEGAYLEDDPANSLSVYGKTKWLGEEAVRKSAAKHVIIRTSWIFGSHGVNFLKTVLKLAQEQSKLSVVKDQVGAPTSARMLAEVTAEIVSQLFSPGAYKKYGTYHLVSMGETSWYGYAQHILSLLNSLGIKTKLVSDQVKPVTTAQYPMPAVRPKNSRLDVSKIREVFGVELPGWEQQVEKVIKEIYQ